MRRGKKIWENENLLIYVGTAIFFILAIAIGIIMYMGANSNSKVGKSVENTVQQQEERKTQDNENTESASSSIGKTVKEQQSNISIKPENNIIDKNTTSTNSNTTSKNTNTNTTKNNTQTNTSTENKVTETKKEITFIKPIEGDIICEYAKDNLIYSETLKEWITHTAIDIKADKTSVIKAAAAGVIKSIVNDPRYGLTVVIEHDDGYETVYSNLLTAEFVVEGEEVEQGQTIGTAGNTASFESSMECHLHFELLKDGEYLDPAIYVK